MSRRLGASVLVLAIPVVAGLAIRGLAAIGAEAETGAGHVPAEVGTTADEPVSAPVVSPFTGPATTAPPQELTNEECLLCHAEADVVEMAEVDPRPGLVVDVAGFGDSVHADFDCVFCHEGIEDVPHAPDLPAVDPRLCGDCHFEAGEAYELGVHGVALAAGDEDAPGCTSCHGVHDIHAGDDPASTVHPLALPETCGTCHGDQAFAREHSISVPDPYRSFVEGAHGRGLLRAGLLVSASCNDCHGAHDIRPSEDPDSRIARTNLPNTCGGCHEALLARFDESIHGQKLTAGDPDAPTCDSCHAVHRDEPETEDGFAAAAVAECGNCHADKLGTYRGTYHGKVNALGYADIAACSSCHTAHRILPASDPASTISDANILDTCSRCHEGATESFTRYVVHADPTDPERFPLLFAIYFGMLGLLGLTMIVATAHTVLWYRRLRIERRRRGEPFERPAYREATDEPEVVRFNLFNRVLHLLVMSSFILLVATGLPVRFADTPWARTMVGAFGGFRAAGYLHRFGAVIMVVYVAMHLGYLVWLRWGRGERGILFGPESLMPRRRDLTELVGHVRWFLGKGPRPRFGRWTYWEKFDYFADAWGVIVFGASGMILWFPVFFTRWLPGWAINVATIVHGIEALLALSFIFTVHFFNAHLRPGKFPMDPVFLTGRITVQELEDERPREYEAMLRDGSLHERTVEPSSVLTRHYARVVGYTALTVGLVLVALVVVTVLVALLG